MRDVEPEVIAEAHRGGRVHSGKQDDELLAAEAGKQVAGAFDRILQATGDQFEHPVANVMAMRVVELLEVVDIENRDRA